jgi:predicted peroxiredoxin
MTRRFRPILCLLGVVAMAAAITQQPVLGQAGAAKSRILVHVTHGPEQPTRAALAFLVARTALDEGHAVTLFLAGDAVQLIRDPVLDNLAGLGTGKLRELYDGIVKGGGRFYLSGMSSSARGVTSADLAGKPAEFAQPAVLVRLALEHERMFTY